MKWWIDHTNARKKSGHCTSVSVFNLKVQPLKWPKFRNLLRADTTPESFQLEIWDSKR